MAAKVENGGVDDYRRARTFERLLQAAAATRVVSLPFGWAVLTEDLPRVYDANQLIVNAPVTAATLLAATDDLLGGSGLAHRKIVMEETQPAADLTAALVGAGYEVDVMVTMAWRRPFDRSVPADDVDQLTFDRYAPFQTEASLEQPWCSDRQLANMLVELTRRVAAASDASFLVARVGPVPAAGAHLYRGDGVAQIEEVVTLLRHRGRGLARRVVQAAIQLALERDPHLVFLTAAEDDWPKDFYRRVGFDPVGRTFTFTRRPGADAGI